MSGFNRHPWLKWEQVEKFLGQKLPFAEKGQTFLDNMMLAEGYVQDVLKKAMPGLEATLSTAAIQNEVFETHEHVIIKVKIPKDEDPRNLQVFVKSTHIKITGFANGNKSRIIKLSTLVLPRTARVRYRQRLLEIKLRKRGLKELYHEAYIRY
ncbi:Hsp20/alpha crystallin family protein [Paenibacillus oryzisoli]|uniref:Hsp20/alpha crystallin family protein n=1 Tax=Paenibacillus oryzisoli TaxID=1850517 RepID=UPI003D2DAE50